MDFLNLNLKSAIAAEIEEFDIPLHITDFIEMCQIYSSLGEYQVFIDELIENNEVKSIPVIIIPKLIKFFEIISKNPYFGDAAEMSKTYVLELKRTLKTYKNSLN